MQKVRISINRPDCLVLDIGRDSRRAALWLSAVALWPVLISFAGLDTLIGLIVLGIGMAVVPLAGIRAFRHLRRRSRTLVRTPGRLFLDGEPLEMARVELRVISRFVSKVPTGYELSLWLMTTSGPEDLPLGHFKTLTEASRVSGQLEEFVLRAGAREPRHA